MASCLSDEVHTRLLGQCVRVVACFPKVLWTLRRLMTLYDRSRRSREMQIIVCSPYSSKLLIADSFSPLRAVEVMIVQQSGSFIRVETELSGSFDLETCAFSLCFSGFWHFRLTAPDSLKGPLPWCECETKFRSSWRTSVQFSGDSIMEFDLHARKGCGRRCAVKFASVPPRVCRRHR